MVKTNKVAHDATYATGGCKTSVARVFLFKSERGGFIINGVDAASYCSSRRNSLDFICEPLILSNISGISIYSTVKGGGLFGQFKALRHGLSQALAKFDFALRADLKRAGLLTRDSRIVERKKFGQKGARKRFQFSKR